MLKFIIIIFSFFNTIHTLTLQEAYNEAESYAGYDKYVILDSETIYTGGLGIYEGDIFIDCNGATIDLQTGQGIWVYADEQYPSSLDIQECSITNGLYYGLSYGGTSNGNVINCNFHSTNFGLKLFDESNVYITNSIFSSQQSMGIGVYTEDPIINGDYIVFWDNEDNCMENCPGWGNVWTQFELSPGTLIIYNDPLFSDASNFDFTLNENSPCINSGNPNYNDSDGSISDIGANPFSSNECMISGDINNDQRVDVLDIVDLVCVIINPSTCFNECSGDLNNDNTLNVLDIVVIVNLILS